MEQYIPYIIPPLLGAFIGYVTNYIAIRMLFRPLKPWRIFGLRVPLTPGIIPSKRHELAARMGEMVGSHLLTSKDVGHTLGKEGFRRELKNTVAEKVGNFLDKELGPLSDLVPGQFQQRFRDFIDIMRWKVVRLIFDYLESDDFEDKLRGFLHRKGQELLSRDLESYLTPQRYERLRTHLDDRVSTFLQSPGVAQSVGNYVDSKTEQWMTSERSIRELIPGDLVEVLLDQLEREIPPLLEKFGGMLYDPNFRERLTTKGKEAIENFLDSLGGLAGLLSGFIDLDTIYNRIPDFLDKAGDEIARWLREPETQKNVGEMLAERVDVFLDRPLSNYLEKVPFEKVSGVRKYIRNQAVDVVQSRRASESALALIENGVDRLKDRSFASLLEKALPEGGTKRAQEMLADRILATLRAPQARTALEQVLAQKAEEWIFQHPLGKLSSRLPADVREEIDEGICLQVEELLKKEVPPLVETLNIRRMVEDKVNTLDLLQVEGLLMGVMKEQFKYINIFGALLGFMIGLVNLLAFYLR